MDDPQFNQSVPHQEIKNEGGGLEKKIWTWIRSPIANTVHSLSYKSDLLWQRERERETEGKRGFIQNSLQGVRTKCRKNSKEFSKGLKCWKEDHVRRYVPLYFIILIPKHPTYVNTKFMSLLSACSMCF